MNVAFVLLPVPLSFGLLLFLYWLGRVGFVQKIYVDEGQKVKKGQPLFQLSSDQYSETVKEAQANYKQAQAQYEMANYEAERIGRLVDKQILSKIRLDQANKEKEVAVKRGSDSGVRIIHL